MIRFENGIVSGASYKEALDLIYGNKLKIPKVIGYYFSGNDVSRSDHKIRFVKIRENMFTCMKNFGTLIFVPRGPKKMVGETTYEVQFNFIKGSNLRREEFQEVCKNFDIVTNIKENLLTVLNNHSEVMLTLLVTEGSGYYSIEDSHRLISSLETNTTWVPMENLFSLVDHVRILPPDDNGVVRYKLTNISEEELNTLLKGGV